jgi:type I restriction-modification system DNA methylase subunit
MARKPSRATFRELIESVSARTGRRASECFSSFCLMAACAVSAGSRESEYMGEARRWEREELELFGDALGALALEMESKPYEDLLGPHFMEVAGSNAGNGEFYTPAHLTRMMADLTLPAELPDGPLRIAEPSCGSGGAVLASAEALAKRGISPMRLRAQCTDVSRTACDMCFINLTLWAVPAEIVHGNTLSGEVWGRWKTPCWLLALCSAQLEQQPEAQADENGQFAFPIEVAA